VVHDKVSCPTKLSEVILIMVSLTSYKKFVEPSKGETIAS
jgi:hypothetical protein